MTPAPQAAKQWSVTAIAQVLVAHNALATLTARHAHILAQHMRLSDVPVGTVMFKAGDLDTDFMALVLEGEALVEAQGAGAGDAVVLKIIGEGDVLGEMGIIANIARSATVTASTDMTVAILDQSDIAQLVKDAPELACAFLSTLLHSLSNRLRESNRKLQTMTKINQSMFSELEASRNNESDLADLFASSSTIGRLLVKTDDKQLPQDSQPPTFPPTRPA